jgi:hypothetical protein
MVAVRQRDGDEDREGTKDTEASRDRTLKLGDTEPVLVKVDVTLKEGEGVGDVEEEEGEEEVDLLTTMSEEEASNVFQNFFDV